jgi:hypothetical protein
MVKMIAKRNALGSQRLPAYAAIGKFLENELAQNSLFRLH